MQTVRVCALCAAVNCAFIGTPPARGQIEPDCYVDVTQTGNPPDGESWATAYPSLQSAIDNADCGVIWVADGTYLPTHARSGVDWVPSGKTFEFRNGSDVYGGFAGDENWQTFDLADRGLKRTIGPALLARNESALFDEATIRVLAYAIRR